MLDLRANGATSHNLRVGNRSPHGSGSPEGAFPCQGEDRWVAISVLTDGEWGSLVHVMDNPAWAQEGRFSTADARSSHAEELDSLLETWTRQHTAEEIMRLLQDAGVAAGVVQTGADLAEHDPHIKERGFFRQVLDAQGVSRTIEGAPYKLSRTPGGAKSGAPAFGADQTYVLRDVLGMSDDVLADCAIAGVFE